MAQPKITLACRNYDGTNAILRGLVRPSGFDLQINEINDPPRMFAAMIDGEFDVSEMSLAEMIYYLSRDRCNFIGIPVFPSRLFRHGFLFCNVNSKISDPRDLNGKIIGGLRWVQTAFVWLRGMLVEEYGISPGDTHWRVSALHHWQGHGSEEKITPRDGSTIEPLTGPGSDEYDVNCRALLEGRIDALMTTENRKYDILAKDPRVRPLFENSRYAESAYYGKNKIIPIMHLMVIRRSTVESYPDLPEKLFRIFCDAKKISREWFCSVPSLTIAWKNEYLRDEKKIFDGHDPWAYGLEANRTALERFLSYSYAEGISAREIRAEDLFVRSTWNLSDS
jgi:4,5-dihydroxyphthalate decarboxylase